MCWYKVFSGMPQDAKLAAIARRSGVQRGTVLAIWIALLDHASTAAPRGSLKDIEPEEIAAALECDAAAVETVVAALREKKMILPEGMVAGWRKHQSLSTPRTRAYRARAVACGETDAARRQRLQNDISARHKQDGRLLAAQRRTQ